MNTSTHSTAGQREANQVIIIRNASFLLGRSQIGSLEVREGESIRIEGNRVVEMGTSVSEDNADRVIDANGKIVLPGFVNTHHHMFQALMRCMPAFQNRPITEQIDVMARVARNMDEESVYNAYRANMGELLLYGCTTSADMLYMYPNNRNELFDATMKAADEMGIRFHAYRGSMSKSEKDGALYPDDIVQDSDNIAAESVRVIGQYHDASEFSMRKVGIGPVTIFASRAEDYRNAAEIAEKYDVLLQTHLSEEDFETEYAQEHFGKRPMEYLKELGWTDAKRISYAHCVAVNDDEISEFAREGYSVSHCPISNSRTAIGSVGIAPIWDMLEAGVNVSIGVDGSAGNDSSNVVEELRWARTIQGASDRGTYLDMMKTYEIGTINGARLLRMEDQIGSLEVGKAADIAIFDPFGHLEYAGAHWDPVGSLLSHHSRRAHTVIVNGRIVVEDSQLLVADEKEISQALQSFVHSIRD